MKKGFFEASYIIVVLIKLHLVIFLTETKKDRRFSVLIIQDWASGTQLEAVLGVCVFNLNQLLTSQLCFLFNEQKTGTERLNQINLPERRLLHLLLWLPQHSSWGPSASPFCFLQLSLWPLTDVSIFKGTLCLHFRHTQTGTSWKSKSRHSENAKNK